MYVNRKSDTTPPRYTLEVWPDATAASKPAATIGWAYARDAKVLRRIAEALVIEAERLEH